jgi:hypothetical protein
MADIRIIKRRSIASGGISPLILVKGNMFATKGGKAAYYQSNKNRIIGKYVNIATKLKTGRYGLVGRMLSACRMVVVRSDCRKTRPAG